ncbi:MAG: hypothetical protein M0Q91_07500 [Methanoregula sp.]|jgi:hypothetical protein|nr:hypothetical protein [Methanoregula sp.]
MTEMIEGSGSMSCQIENPAAKESMAANVKTVSPIQKSYRACRYYKPTKAAGGIPCILNDLCDQRQITDCPVRVSFCQLVNESDEDFASFLADRNLTPEMNLENFYTARCRA